MTAEDSLEIHWSDMLCYVIKSRVIEDCYE